jgi:hypothetical protein
MKRPVMSGRTKNFIAAVLLFCLSCVASLFGLGCCDDSRMEEQARERLSWSEEWARKEPSNVEANATYANALEENFRYQEAKAIWLKVLSSDPNGYWSADARRFLKEHP